MLGFSSFDNFTGDYQLTNHNEWLDFGPDGLLQLKVCVTFAQIEYLFSLKLITCNFANLTSQTKHLQSKTDTLACLISGQGRSQ